MTKQVWGWIAPTVLTAIVVFVGLSASFSRPVKTGLIVGITIAWVQAMASMLSLRWAWKRKSFYAVWGAGVLIRFLLFGVVAFVVYKYTALNLLATLVTMVVATTLFLTLESATVLPNK